MLAKLDVTIGNKYILLQIIIIKLYRKRKYIISGLI